MDGIQQPQGQSGNNPQAGSTAQPAVNAAAASQPQAAPMQSAKVDLAHPGNSVSQQPGQAPAPQPEQRPVTQQDFSAPAAAEVPAASPPAPQPQPATEHHSTVVELAGQEQKAGASAVSPSQGGGDGSGMSGGPVSSGGGGGRKWAVIGLVLLILLAVGGAAYWYFFMREEPAPPEPAKVAVVPETLSGVEQYDASGSNTIEVGALYNQSSLVLTLTQSTTGNSGSLTPQVEVREVGEAFTNQPTHIGDSAKPKDGIVAGAVLVEELSNGKYHWQARFTDGANDGPWLSFGGNDETATDFEVDVTGPSVPKVSTINGKAYDPAADPVELTEKRPKFTGTADPGSKITLRADSLTFSTVAGAGGAWEAVPSSDLSDGNYTLTITAEDEAGNARSTQVALSVSTSTSPDPEPEPEPEPTPEPEPEPEPAPSEDETLAPTGDPVVYLGLLSGLFLITSLGWYGRQLYRGRR